MIRPDYKKNGIVNLASTLLQSFGVKPLYTPIHDLDLKPYRNVVFLLIDGLGYNFLKKWGKNSFMGKHCVKRLTSCFPSTTATATTTLETGVAPQQHGLTGWYTYMKELGLVATPLPKQIRFGGIPLENHGVSRDELISAKRIVDQVRGPAFRICPASYISPQEKSRRGKTLTYKTLPEMVYQIKEAVKSSPKRKLIHAYWPKLDTHCHHKGPSSQEAIGHFKALDKAILGLWRFLEKEEATLVVSADHGLIDTPQNKTVFLHDHPELDRTLTLPPCGEPRAAYCYVRPNGVRDFKRYVKTKLGYCCRAVKSADLLAKGWFGLGPAHPRLEERIGDYTLLMKGHYILHANILHENKKPHAGNHGGVSPDEMLVPLVWVKAKPSPRRFK